MIRVEVAEGNAWLDRGPDEWEALRRKSPDATPFQSFEWLRGWCDIWPQKPFVVHAFEGKDLVGVWPLVRTGWFGDTLRSMGTGPSDILDPIVEPEVGPKVAAEMLERICDTPLLIDLHQIRQPLPVREGFSFHEQATCLVLDLPATFDEYLATLGKSLRADIKRNRSETRSVRFKIVDASECNSSNCIEQLLTLHRRRWRKKMLPGAFVGRSLRFQKLWLPIGIANGSVWLSILFIDGTPAGAIYAFREGQTCFFYQAGMDPDFSGYSPGTTLVAYTIERAIGEGCTRFDFLRGDEPYKRRWKPQRVVTNSRYIRPGQGAMAQMHHAEIEWAAKIECRIRARLESPNAKG